LDCVEGEPFLEYCERLNLSSRLKVFLKVCEAVDHAHRNLVIHRDL
jgi:serine/threonine-protein kinase